MFRSLADPLGGHNCSPLCGVLSEESHVIELWGEDWCTEEHITKCMFEQGYLMLAAHREPDMRPPADGVTGYDYINKEVITRNFDYWVGWAVTIEKEVR